MNTRQNKLNTEPSTMGAAGLSGFTGIADQPSARRAWLVIGLAGIGPVSFGDYPEPTRLADSC